MMILGILAAVVVVNVVGLTGRGEAESYATDERTIQTVVSAFYADVHAYNNNVAVGWNELGNHTSFHKYPTASGWYSSLYAGESVPLNGRTVRVIKWRGHEEATAEDIDRAVKEDAAIWMSLLTKGPGEGTGIAPDKDTSAPLAGEPGPYLNPLPKSCSQNNSSAGSGTITWIVGEYGRIYGVFEQGGVWYAGFGGRYP